MGDNIYHGRLNVVVDFARFPRVDTAVLYVILSFPQEVMPPPLLPHFSRPVVQNGVYADFSQPIHTSSGAALCVASMDKK